MPERDLPLPSYLRQRLRYEPDSGKLFWRAYAGNPQCWNTRWAGREAFTAINTNGYRHGGIDGTLHLAHRVAWAIHHGAWPDVEIDHEDHDRGNNRIRNLRPATTGQNAMNQSRYRSSTSGVTGVHWHRAKGRWQVSICVRGKQRHLGYFDTFDEAVAARKAADQHFDFHPNHGRPPDGQPAA